MILNTLLLSLIVLTFLAIEFKRFVHVRFSLGFFALFSSLIIYAHGEILPALLSLINLSIIITLVMAVFETRFNVDFDVESSYGKSSSLKLLVISLISFLVALALFAQLRYAVMFSATAMNLYALIFKHNILKLMVSLLMIEKLLQLVMATADFLTSPIAAIMNLIMLFTASITLYLASVMLVKFKSLNPGKLRALTAGWKAYMKCD